MLSGSLTGTLMVSGLTFTQCKGETSRPPPSRRLPQDVLEEAVTSWRQQQPLPFLRTCRAMTSLSDEENGGDDYCAPLFYGDFPAALPAPLPPSLSWLWEQDAESITGASANQSAEAHGALRRTAAHNTIKPRSYYEPVESLHYVHRPV